MISQREEDLALWSAAVAVFRGAALADIERVAGVERSAARRLKAGEPAPQYLHKETRRALTEWMAARQAAEALPPVGGSSGVIRFGGAGTGTVGPVFESEERRKGYLQKVLADAARAIREAQEALDAPLSEQAGDAAAPPSGEGEEAERRRQAELAMQLQWEAQQRHLAQQRVLQPAPPPPVRSRG